MKIFEVGPRDGLQNEPGVVPVEDKVKLIEALSAAGLRHIECGSFVSPKWVPQMADTFAVFQQLHRLPGITYSALVPNLTGLTEAIRCQVREIALFASASETFSHRNINCSIAESLDRLTAVAHEALAQNIRIRGYVSCTLGCPYEGAISLESVTKVSAALASMGCYEISLADTIGIGTPHAAQTMVKTVAQAVPTRHLAVHFHDTWGQALANILATLEAGIETIDSSVAGLGGCPYAKGAAGNVATEDVVYMLDGLGIQTNIDLEKLAAAGRQIMSILGRSSTSKAATALAALKEN